MDVPRGRPLLVALAAQHREAAVEQVALVFAAHLQADKRGLRVKAENRLARRKAVSNSTARRLEKSRTSPVARTRVSKDVLRGVN